MEQQASQRREPRDGEGVGGVFGRRELKSFFVNYLVTILVVEGLIFFVCFVTALSSAQALFPWKAFVFAAFTAPIAITFVFAIIILTFNRYIFRAPDQQVAATGSTPGQGQEDKIGRFLHLIQQTPFLLSLLLLIVACWVGYNMDAIALFAARAGEGVLRYFMISLVVMLGVVTVFGLLWLVLSYRLRQQKMASQQRYRQEVMERLGLVILDDNTVLDREGNPMHATASEKEPGRVRQDEEIRLLPRLGRD